MVYGLALPWSLILAASVLGSLLLWRDWRSSKRLFRHLAEYSPVSREEFSLTNTNQARAQSQR